jgi:UDP-2,3-diacylglucosamine pyrophosphatase LpxH
VTAPASPSGDGAWVVVSDLHLGVPEHPPRAAAAAFAAFLTTEIAVRPVPGHLLLLGDMFEMLYRGRPTTSGRAADWAVGRLDELAAAHPTVFAALRTCLRRGWRLEVVCGNHDMALCLDEVRDHLAELLDDPERRGLEFHPWFRLVPGVFYAEHGQQHHDLNRFPALLHPADIRRPERLFVPPLAVAHGRARPAVAGALLAARRHERFAGSAEYRQRLRTFAEQVGLPVAVVAALHEASSLRLSAIAGRLARRSLSRSLRAAPDTYLIEGAGRVHAVLTRSACPVPFYLFGHSHHARVRTLDGPGPAARYVNSGTWSAAVRGDPAGVDLALYPYVEINTDSGAPRVALRYWRHRTCRQTLLSSHGKVGER